MYMNLVVAVWLLLCCQLPAALVNTLLVWEWTRAGPSVETLIHTYLLSTRLLRSRDVHIGVSSGFVQVMPVDLCVDLGPLTG
ncbi:hypothetical protein F5Y15DRAFT_292296 [Xylariaceae sp. FL0016]|nr:hypothetical protein F5Y15DRAFT_292296 [Xylariaceae sp. FL0016]